MRTLGFLVGVVVGLMIVFFQMLFYLLGIVMSSFGISLDGSKIKQSSKKEPINT